MQETVEKYYQGMVFRLLVTVMINCALLVSGLQGRFGERPQHVQPCRKCDGGLRLTKTATPHARKYQAWIYYKQT